MACFVAPMAEAIVVTIVKTIIKNKEKSLGDAIKTEALNNSSQIKSCNKLQTGLSWSRKLSWLNNLLWGGVLLLAIEHLWHGEIVPWPPFLTAMNNPNTIIPMLHEIATAGTLMTVFVTMLWVIMVVIAEQKAKHVLAKSREMRFTEDKACF